MRMTWLALGLACALCACDRASEPKGAEAEDAEAESEPRAVTLAADAARAFATSPAEAAEAPAQLTAAGRVLDGAALVDAAGALARAEVAAQAASRDLTRMRALAQDRANASERELADAELASADAHGALAAAQTRALASFGTSDAARIARIAESLAQGEIAIGRIELPPGAALPGPKDVILVSALAAGGEPQRARLLGPAGSAEPSVQGPAVLVLLGPPPPPAGAALEAQLALGSPVRGVWLPESALVWNEGAANAYVATSATTFERRVLDIAAPLRDGVLVRSGVTPGERVVTSGAAQLLSSQTVSSEPEED
jgi:hypothetical protein